MSREQLIISNGLPIFMKQQQRNLLPIGPGTSTKLFVNPKSCRISSTKHWSPRRESKKPHYLMLGKEDFVKGMSMLDPCLDAKCLLSLRRLETIEERSEPESSHGKSRLKPHEGNDDIKRLDGGCFKSKTSSNESIKEKSKSKKGKNERKSKRVPEILQNKVGLIDNLEEQFHQMQLYLNRLREQMVPPENIEMFNCFSKNLAEVNDLLKDFKGTLEETCKNTEKFNNVLHESEKYEEDAYKIPKNIESDNKLKLSDDKQHCKEPQARETIKRDEQKPEVDENTRNRKSIGIVKNCKKCMCFKSSCPNCVNQYQARKGASIPKDEYDTPPRSSSSSSTSAEVHIESTNYQNSFDTICNRKSLDVPKRCICKRQETSQYCHRPQEEPKYSVNMSTQCNQNDIQDAFIVCCLGDRIPKKELTKNSKRNSNDNCETEMKKITASSAETSAEYMSSFRTKYPVITKKLMKTILKITEAYNPNFIALTIILKSNNLYHINISVTSTGISLYDLYATESALKEAEQKDLFGKFLTFFVLNGNCTSKQKNTIFGHSLKFINTDTSQPTNFNYKSNQINKYQIKLKTKNNRILKKQCNNNTTSLEQISKAFEGKRLRAGKSQEDFKSTNQRKSSTNRGPFSPTGHFIDMSNNATLPREEQSSRLDNLEGLVSRFREELYRIQEQLLPQADIIKFNHLSERLRDLNELLSDLKATYKLFNGRQMTNEIQEKTGRKDLQETEIHKNDNETKNKSSSSTEAKPPTLRFVSNNTLEGRRSNDRYLMNLFPDLDENQSLQVPPDNYAPPATSECQKFLNEINCPKNLLHRHILMMKDFRSDADLRRQRLQRKMQEKLQEKQTEEEDVKILFENMNTRDIATQQGSSDESINYKQLTPTLERKRAGEHNEKQLQEPYTTATKETQTNEIFSFPDSDTPSDSPSITTDYMLPENNDNDTTAKDPIINSNLFMALENIFLKYNLNPSTTVLTITMEIDNVYHINVWNARTGKSLGYLYATEFAIKEADDQQIFFKFLTYIVINEDNTVEQKHKLLELSYRIIKANRTAREGKKNLYFDMDKT